jgi:hypothetical protein
MLAGRQGLAVHRKAKLTIADLINLRVLIVQSEGEDLERSVGDWSLKFDFGYVEVYDELLRRS